MKKSPAVNEQLSLTSEIIFEPNNFTIFHTSTNMSAKLSPTSSRLLYALFLSKGVTVSRKKLFESAYQPYGLIESNNSLNQYISLLRKSINEIGVDGDNIIITIPKEGFMLRDTPYVEGDEKSLSKGPALLTMHKTSTSGVKRYIGVFICFIFLLLVLVLVVSWYKILASENNFNFSASNIRELKTIDRCKIYTFNKKIDDNVLLTGFLENSKKISLDCSKPRTILYYDTSILGKNISGHHDLKSMIVCTENTSINEVNTCVSHYFEEV